MTRRARSCSGWPLAACLLIAIGCGDTATPPSTMALRTPQALTSCDGAPSALQARLWVSGFTEPFALDVDLIAGTTSGTVRVPPGIARRFTVDWFVELDGRVVLLAQATDDLDLGATTDDAVTLTFTEDDVTTNACRAIEDGTTSGSATVDVGGVARPACDLDDDGEPNLDEVCAGRDPLEQA
jgi:hypothetical protein